MANISFNPALTTQPQNSFDLQTQGYIQGLTQDDPTSRMWLSAGEVASTVTQPMWGGMGVTVSVGGLNSSGQSLASLALATNSQIQGFTVFDQAINMQIVPGNSVPTAVAGQSMAYYSFGSNARIPVPVASGAFAGLETAYTNTTLYWDTSAFNLTTTSGSSTVQLPSTVQVLAVDNNSKAVVYTSGTGAVNWDYGQQVALIKI